MGNSLRDQLLKAGLVGEEQAKKAKRERYKQRKRRKHDQTREVDAAKLGAERAMAAKAERDRELNRQRQEKAARNALAAEVRQLIEANRLPREEGEVAFNFPDGKKIKRILVSERTRARLARGQLAIVKLDGRYEVVPAAVAERLRERAPARVLLSHTGEPGDEEESPYSEFPIPDDLTW